MSKLRYTFYSAVYVIIKRENKILMLRRFNTGWMDGMYTLPAGHIEESETAEQTASREILEEVGINIPPNALSVAHVMLEKSADNKEYFNIFIEAKNFSDEPTNKEKDKCDEVAWFSLDSLPDNTLPCVKEALRQITEGNHYSNFGF
ncbi:MAG: NUDIX domain-containing protein [bacterium]